MSKHVDVASTMIFAILVYGSFLEEIGIIWKGTFGEVSAAILLFIWDCCSMEKIRTKNTEESQP